MTSPRFRLARWIFAAVMLSTACVGRVAPVATHSGANGEAPRASWTVSTTSPEGTERIICRSESRTQCQVPASTPSAKTFAAVHLYLHPSIDTTTYTGNMRVGLFNGFAPDVHKGTIESIVNPGEEPFDVSVTGPVTPIPGVYSITISLVATSTNQPSPQRIQDTIAVTVSGH